MDLISVIIPTYNVELYVRKAVESILEQTYKNIEVIIVDDGSTDNTYEILKELEYTDSRIRLYRNEKNMNICYSLNKALSLSKGDYIARMDGDDVSHNERLEVMLAYLKKNPHIDLVGTNTIAIDEFDNELGRRRFCDNYRCLASLAKFNSPIPHIWMTKRYVYKKLNGYRNLPYAEDYDFLLRMITSGLKFTNISDYYGYKVRSRQGNTISTAGLKQLLAADYAKKLYDKRRRYEYDDFSDENFQKALLRPQRVMRLHAISNEYLKRAIRFKAKKSLKWMHFVFIACIVSPYQFNYVFNSTLYKLITWLYFNKKRERV